MASIEEIKGQLEAAKQAALSGMKALASAQQQADSAVTQMQAAARGTANPKVAQATRAFQGSKAKLDEARAAMAAGIKAATEYQQSI